MRLRFECMWVFGVCVGSLSSENSMCGGGCSDSCRGGGRRVDCSVADKGGFTSETQED